MTTSMTGRFESAELVNARRRFDGPAGPGDPAGRPQNPTRAAEVCAARRRFDGALGREGSGGAESFQPKFGRRPRVEPDVAGADEPLLVLDLHAGVGTLTFPLADFRDVAAAADQRLRRSLLAGRASRLLARIDEERGRAGWGEWPEPDPVQPHRRPITERTPLPPLHRATATPVPPVAVSVAVPAMAAGPAGLTPMPPLVRQVSRSAMVPTEVVIGPRTRPAPSLDAAFPDFDTVVAKIRTLGALRNEGLITDGEYERKKGELLARI